VTSAESEKVAEKNDMIPWAAKEVWSQVVLSLGKTITAMGEKTAGIRRQAEQIFQGYGELDTVLERVCLESCPTCTDVCCTRATVWYDLSDLLVIYLNTGTLPRRQIYRKPDHSCCNLTPAGCRLTRSDRPFICTWYICPDQQKILFRQANRSRKELAVFRTVNAIKAARKELQQAYIDTLCD
jgi:hypothetical protein